MDTAAYLVGGPVRDLLLGRPAPDLDVAVEGPVTRITEALAKHLCARLQKTTEFMTSTLVLEDGIELDIARTRTETYPEPGALPVVAPATLTDDLGRRDFTVNAMAMSLQPQRFGELIDPFGGRQDLEDAQLRVLHDRSFIDDPTRMLRAARFMLRLDFVLESETEKLLRTAVRGRLLAALSGARLRNELDCIFREAPARGLAMLQRLGLFECMGLAAASADACEAAALLPRAARELEISLDAAGPTAACLGVYAGLSEQDPVELAARLMLDACCRDAVYEASALIVNPPDVLTGDARDSELFFALRGMGPATALALWTTPGDAARERLAHYWCDLRGAQADIDGADLMAAGYEPQPAFSVALQAALVAKLDRDAGREEQLAVALSTLDDAND